MPSAAQPLPTSLAERTRALNHAPVRDDGAFVLYWMRTAVRGRENPALDVAITLGNQLRVPVFVYHAVSERYRFASDRHHTFILEGARDVAGQLAERGVATAFHCERPGHRGPHLVTLGQRAAAVITEDMPVFPLRDWTRDLAGKLSVAVWAVDTACVVPMRRVGKGITRAFAYRTRIKPLLHPRLGPWTDIAPDVEPAPVADLPFVPVDWRRDRIADLVAACDIDHTIGPVPHTVGGSKAGYARWDGFRENAIRAYVKARDDANRHGSSRLSPYLHYGMIAPTRVAREATARRGRGTEKFLDELIIWREMAYTWCLHAREHETLEALPDWARATLLAHLEDPRDARYPREVLERGKTGHELWDLAQTSLRVHGELHNDVRMTWGKALLSFTPGPQDALDVLIDLNHRYALDGRDPASYGGLLWCLGLFDRPSAPEQAILGKVRSRPLAEHAGRLDVATWSAHVHRPLVPRPPRVAVIGGGPAGALCARTLADHQIPVVVFDKGRGPGGRTSTRFADDARFDHGAQYFTARDRHLARRIRSWVDAGVLARWNGPFGELSVEGVAMHSGEGDLRHVGVPGMYRLVEFLLDDVDLLDVRFSARVTGIRRSDDAFDVVLADGTTHRFDQVIVAVPAPQAVALLDLTPALRARMAAVEIAPCWAVMARFADAIDVPWAAVRVQDARVAWIARDQTKPGRPPGEQWVIHATPGWSRAHLEDERPAVSEALLAAVRELVRIDQEPTRVLAHRWRHALVEKPVGEPCLFADGVGVCGDGLLGGRVESALVSGAAMAGRVLGALADRASNG